MTIPTPERVRELIAMFLAKDSFLAETAFSADTAAILADWLRLTAPTQARVGEKPVKCDGKPAADCLNHDDFNWCWDCNTNRNTRLYGGQRSAASPTPSAQAKCERCNGSGSSPTKRDMYNIPAKCGACNGTGNALPSAQAREALEAAPTYKWNFAPENLDELSALLTKHWDREQNLPRYALQWVEKLIDQERTRQAIALRSPSANVGGGGGNAEDEQTRAQAAFDAHGLKHWDAFWIGWCLRAVPVSA